MDSFDGLKQKTIHQVINDYIENYSHLDFEYYFDNVATPYFYYYDDVYPFYVEYDDCLDLLKERIDH